MELEIRKALSVLHLLWHCSDVSKSLPEDHKDASRATAQGRRGAVKSRVSCAKNYHIAMHLGKLRFTCTHACNRGNRVKAYMLYYKGLGNLLICRHIVDRFMGTEHTDNVCERAFEEDMKCLRQWEF